MKTTKTGKAHRANNKIPAQEGFTIVEIMIFLAVSGFMFILAAVFISGKQANVAYHQSMLAAGSTVTSVINSVANGEYPALPDGYACVADVSSMPPRIVSGAAAQGSNGGCVFSGKVLQFTDDSNIGRYKAFTTVGRQFKWNTKPSDMVLAQSFLDADPRAAKAGSDYISETGVLENGLTYNKGYLCNGKCDGSNGNEAEAIGGVGFFGSFNDFASNAVGAAGSGSQTVTVVAMPPTNDMPNTINNWLFFARADGLSQSPQYPEIVDDSSYIVLCYENGNNLGQVVIGGPGGQQTSVNVKFGGGVPCES